MVNRISGARTVVWFFAKGNGSGELGACVGDSTVTDGVCNGTGDTQVL